MRTGDVAYTLKSCGWPDRSSIPLRWITVCLALSAAAVTAMMWRNGLFLVPRDPGFAIAAVLMIGLGALRYKVREPMSGPQRQVRDFSEDALLFCLICLLGIVASYPVAAATTGFVDPFLENFDRDLHFNWLFWYREVSTYRTLQYAGTIAYAAIFVSPFLILGHFAHHGRRTEARQFLLTFWLGAVITLALFWRFPAEGPLAFLWHGPIPYMPTSALYQEQLIPILRSHRMSGISVWALRGLVCAPSFHTVSAVTFIAAAWRDPRLLRIILPLNVAMLLATPIEGTHYLSDMIAGLVVALLAIATIALIVREREIGRRASPTTRNRLRRSR